MNAGAAPEILGDSQGSSEIYRGSQGSTKRHFFGLVSFHDGLTRKRKEPTLEAQCHVAVWVRACFS